MAREGGASPRGSKCATVRASVRVLATLAVAVLILSLLAECVALWGEPEQAVHGVKERRAAASSGMKGKRVTIRLVVALQLLLM